MPHMLADSVMPPTISTLFIVCLRHPTTSSNCLDSPNRIIYLYLYSHLRLYLCLCLCLNLNLSLALFLCSTHYSSKYHRVQITEACSFVPGPASLHTHLPSLATCYLPLPHHSTPLHSIRRYLPLLAFICATYVPTHPRPFFVPTHHALPRARRPVPAVLFAFVTTALCYDASVHASLTVLEGCTVRRELCELTCDGAHTY